MENKRPFSFEECHQKVCEQVENFEENLNHYKSKDYLEAQLRQDFLDPFFTYLGWDVSHKFQKNPYKQEVKIEKTQKQKGSGGKKFADYAFYLDPDYKNPIFFVEAKKPAVVLGNNKEYYLQTHKYGWNAQVPVSILTDFEEFIIIDCRAKPNIKYSHNTAVKKYNFKDYLDPKKFKEIYYLFSREAVVDNSIPNFVDTQMKITKGKAIQGKLFGGSYKSVDDEFLNYIDELRKDLARGFIAKNPELSSDELTEATQKTIDRLVFIRFLEDKQIEYDDHIYDIRKWKDFISLSKALDTKYNGVVFKPCIIDSSTFDGIDDTLFTDFCIDISSKESPYNFNAIPIHIIGNIYERFLGKIVSVDNGKVEIELKPEVRKAGGIFYTPKFIVDYLVEKTVGSQIKGKTPKQIDMMSFADISCGSGSFLIGVYECLIDYHKEYYYSNLQGKTKITKGHDDYGNAEFREGDWFITLKRKQEILLNCVFGVDIDSQAVEVTQLSLFLKLLEEESLGTTTGFQTSLYSKVLPDLTSNIKCGNSLVGWDVSTNMGGLSIEEERQINPFDYSASFPKISPKGFDAIVGNPPYVKEGKIDKRVMEYIKNSYCAPYYQGKMDIWYFFVCNGLDLLKEDGLLGYIAPNNWTTNAGASKMRNKVIRDSKILEMIDFGSYMVFEDASIQTMNFILQKNKSKDSYTFLYSKLVDHNKSNLDAIALLDQEENVNNVVLAPILKRKDFVDKYLVFGNKQVSKLLSKIKAKSNFILDEKLEVAQGIVPNPDVIGTRNIKKIPTSEITKHKIVKGDGVFVVNRGFFKSLSSSESSFIKPVYEPYLCNRYSLGEFDKEMIYSTVDNSINKAHSNLYNHLSKYQVIMDERRENLKGARSFYHLHWPRDPVFFQAGPKIISVRKCDKPTFIYSEKEVYVMMSFNVIKSDRINLKYLTAILNSKLCEFWLKNKGKMQGDNFQIDKEPLLDIPILKSNDKAIIFKISKLVDEITLTIKNKTKATTQKESEFLDHKITNLEGQINNEVYKLYDITTEEVAIIEQS